MTPNGFDDNTNKEKKGVHGKTATSIMSPTAGAKSVPGIGGSYLVDIGFASGDSYPLQMGSGVQSAPSLLMAPLSGGFLTWHLHKPFNNTVTIAHISVCLVARRGYSYVTWRRGFSSASARRSPRKRHSAHSHYFNPTCLCWTVLPAPTRAFSSRGVASPPSPLQPSCPCGHETSCLSN